MTHSTPNTILILGGYGVFGQRLAKLISDIPDLELLICGRNLDRAEVFCADYVGQAKVRPVELDRQNIDKALSEYAPDLVVDASGPFQNYGADQYKVITSCIAAKINYLDFADAADFVFGVSQFDEQAKRAGCFVLSGVSSFPVLTAAVLREMAKDMDIVSVQGGIAPSVHAGIGLNVMRAVVGYAGSPVKLLRHGVRTTGVGLAETMRYTVAVPGRLPLRNTHFSLVDVPDLQVIPPEHPGMTDIWMGAGPVPEVLHKILNFLAKLRVVFRLPSFEPLSPLFYRVLNAMKFGEHRGGMFVHALGTRDGKQKEISWHLLAEGDDGPYIPSMAIEAVVRKLRAGEKLEFGARPATRALDLRHYEELFKRRAIFSAFRRHDNDQPLYRQILGSAFDNLPKPVQALHGDKTQRHWTGHAEVRRGSGALARMLCAIFGFPPATDRVAIDVDFKPDQTGELWSRNFNGKKFSSHQSCGAGKDQHLLVEKFGALSVSIALVIKDTKLYLVPRRWSLLGVPMPNWLLPSGNSFETEVDGKFHFNVEINAPIVGLVVAYKGALLPVKINPPLLS